MWRAIRYGLDGRLLDLEAPRVEEFPAAEALDRLRAWTGADVGAARAQRRAAPAAHDRRGRDAGGGVRRVPAGNPSHILRGDRAMSQPEFSEEELRQLEAEMERITVDDVLIQTTVTLLNLAARKAGLGAPPGEGPARRLGAGPPGDRGRPRAAAAARVAPRRAARPGPRHARAPADGLRAGRRRAGGAGRRGAGGRAAGARRKPGESEGPGPAQSSGRLWVPGQ